MPLDAIALVLIAALIHAGWNRLLHQSGDREAVMALSGWLTGIVMVPLFFIWPPWQVWPLILLSGLAQAVYGILLSAAYQRGMLSVSYPIARGTAPLFVTLGGWLLLSQTPGPGAIAGSILLAIGLATIARVGSRSNQGAAVLLAACTGLAIASYQIIDAAAVRDVNPAGYLGPVFLVQGILITVWMMKTRNYGFTKATIPALFRGSYRPGALVAFGSTAAYLLVVFALQRADAGRVATLREVSILIGVLISGQRPGRATLIGAMFVVAGTLLAAF
ncbi:MAG TPA: EamA family transporter [Thermomicrobiales bacterium]|nr:EamA family transporter [Thermomicrobiales bacterium]